MMSIDSDVFGLHRHQESEKVGAGCECGILFLINYMFDLHIESKLIFGIVCNFFDLKRHWIAGIKTVGFGSLKNFIGSPADYH